MEMLSFNMESGYLEGVVRGYRSSLLQSHHYTSLTQCETLDDFKMLVEAAHARGPHRHAVASNIGSVSSPEP